MKIMKPLLYYKLVVISLFICKLLWCRNVISISKEKDTNRKRSFRSNSPLNWENIWTRKTKVPDNVILTFRFSIKSTIHNELNNILYDISLPNSDQYGKYKTDQEIKDLLTIPLSIRNRFYNLLSSYHCKLSHQLKENKYGDHIEAKLIVKYASILFKTTFYYYQHIQTKEIYIRPFDKYEIPEDIHPYVYYIYDLEHFPSRLQMKSMMKKKNKYKLQDNNMPDVNISEKYPIITSSIIRNQYHIPDKINGTSSNNRLMIASYLNEFYSKDDVNEYINKNCLPIESATESSSFFNESCISNNSTGEASLDVQISIGTSYINGFQVKCMDGLRNNSKEMSPDNQEPFLEFMLQINDMDDPPSVISFSYGDDECAMPLEYMEAVNREFIKAGIKGITIVVSSGDNGAYGSEFTSYCTRDPLCQTYQPGFPSSSPYITSVGATMLSRNKDCIRTDTDLIETVASVSKSGVITSGGGFSSIFKQPNYQRNAVKNYIIRQNSSITDKSRFNKFNRGFPDVSAVGHKIQVFVNGKEILMSGTSASAPLIANIFILINKKRNEMGLGHLGFVNPLLYKLHEDKPWIFRDITIGDNRCGDRSQGCCANGFPASPNWDPVTGLGAILYKEFINEMMKEHLSENNKNLNLFLSSEKNQINHSNWNITTFAIGIILMTSFLIFKIYFTNNYKKIIYKSEIQERDRLWIHEKNTITETLIKPITYT